VVVKQANNTDIPVIENILLSIVDWMEKNGLPQWGLENVKWENLSKYFEIGNFYIAYDNSHPVACMALIDYDPNIWNDIPKGESLFIHKLAVMRDYAGKGFSKELIDFAKLKARSMGIKTLRLDSRADRPKVRAVYENQDFICVAEKAIFGIHKTAFYECKL
jgi:GNAT superfamily N-acetyltransferase